MTESSNKLDVLRDFINSADSCLLTSNLTKMPLQLRPQPVREIDNAGEFWFKRPRPDAVNPAFLKNTTVKIVYSNNERSEHVSIYGEANIFVNDEREDGFWSHGRNSAGSAALSLYHIRPLTIHYWDKTNSQMVPLLTQRAEEVADEIF